MRTRTKETDILFCLFSCFIYYLYLNKKQMRTKHMNLKGISRDMNNIFHTSICEMIKKSIKESLQDEDRIVKFNNRTYPRFGQAVIMVGGSGSGKSFCIGNSIIPIDAKIFDTDEFKKKYIQLQSNPN